MPTAVEEFSGCSLRVQDLQLGICEYASKVDPACEKWVYLQIREPQVVGSFSNPIRGEIISEIPMLSPYALDPKP